jgi:hypothetical protein
VRAHASRLRKCLCLSVWLPPRPRRARGPTRRCEAAAQSAAPRCAAPRRVSACARVQRTHACRLAARAQIAPLTPLIPGINPSAPHLRLGCALRGCASVPPAPAVCDARALPCCADAAAAPSLRRCAAPLWMRAEWRHAAALRRVQWPGGVRCAAGGARRQQGGKERGALRCALSRRCLLCAASARPRLRSAALCRSGAHARAGGAQLAAPSVYLRLPPVCLPRGAATRAAARMRAATCGHNCGAAAARHWRGDVGAFVRCRNRSCCVCLPPPRPRRTARAARRGAARQLRGAPRRAAPRRVCACVRNTHAPARRLVPLTPSLPN